VTEPTFAERVAAGIARGLKKRKPPENTRYWLARVSGVPQSSISKIELHRQRSVDGATALAIAHALGMTLSELIGDR
jgi:hypothetical protein